MTQKEILELFELLDISDIRTSWENVTSIYFDEDFSTEQEVKKYYIDIIFNVQGRNSYDGFKVKDVTIKDAILWINEHEKEIIKDSTLMKIERILIQKINEIA